VSPQAFGLGKFGKEVPGGGAVRHFGILTLPIAGTSPAKTPAQVVLGRGPENRFY